MKRIFVVFAISAGVLLMVFAGAERHAQQSTVPRFCADPRGVLERVELILTKTQPIGEGSKRPFIISAKLIFLIPQQDGETIDDYMGRLQRHLDKIC